MLFIDKIEKYIGKIFLSFCLPPFLSSSLSPSILYLLNFAAGATTAVSPVLQMRKLRPKEGPGSACLDLKQGRLNSKAVWLESG